MYITIRKRKEKESVLKIVVMYEDWRNGVLTCHMHAMAARSTLVEEHLTRLHFSSAVDQRRGGTKFEQFFCARGGIPRASQSSPLYNSFFQNAIQKVNYPGPAAEAR